MREDPPHPAGRERRGREPERREGGERGRPRPSPAVVAAKHREGEEPVERHPREGRDHHPEEGPLAPELPRGDPARIALG
ncbi:MAG: hypothetical protein ACK56I_25315, partial [bacterium]